MKKILYTLLATAIALISCTDEIGPMDSYSKGNVVLTVYNSTMTKAITDPNGLEYERVLKTLDCFFYVKGGADLGLPCVYYQRLDPVPDNAIDDGRSVIQLNITDDILNKIFPDANTECDVFVIANLPANHEYEADAEGTEVPSLNKTLLEADKNGYDGLDKPFAMAGLDIATKSTDAQGNDSVEGEIPLYRASAKITISVNIPESITAYATKFDGEGNILRDEEGMPLKDAYIMTPVFVENENGSEVVALQTAFHNGVSKTYLNDEYVDAEGKSLIEAADYFFTTKKRYKAVGEIPATGTAPKQYVYTCEVPFYSYARAWERGGDNAAYLSFQMPWKNEATGNYRLYYYQIPINITDNRFAPNHWYDITANIGVLGSTVESQPYLIGEMSFYVLDWTTEPDAPYGDRYEDIVMEKYTYLVVPEKRIEINNADSGKIPYEASHKIGIMMDPAEKIVEFLDDETTEMEAFYLYCGPRLNTDGSVATDSSGKPYTQDPEPKSLPITKANFTDNGNGTITYNYQIPASVYSPVYSYIIIWLDFDGDKVLDKNYPDGYEGVREDEFVEYVTVVQYPPIYVTPDKTTQYSIYVNNENRYTKGTGTSRSDAVQFEHENGYYYGLGVVPGTNTTTGEKAFMYTITVTSLKETDVFYYNATTHSSADTQSPYQYIIGDPRSRESDTVLNNDNHDTNENWVTAPSVDGTNRKLQHYYPTSTEDGAFQVIAPKFRIVSFHGNGHRFHNYEGAKMRCASYQEDGYPAGRWRLPTFAELQFIVKLQEAYVICPIFFGSSKYFTPTTQVTYNQNGSSFNTTSGDFTSPSREGGTGSVRCVYDEWYWGNEKEAVPSTDSTPNEGEEYLFTWGDRQIW